jgi:hypothetical protein
MIESSSPEFDRLGFGKQMIFHSLLQKDKQKGPAPGTAPKQGQSMPKNSCAAGIKDALLLVLEIATLLV